MNLNNQKEKFLKGEADRWMQRNFKSSQEAIHSWIKNDPLLPMLKEIPLQEDTSTKVLEIGMGQGLRLVELREKKNWDVYGLDPSKNAVNFGKKLKLKSQLGTADKLPFENNKFDLIIYGFCLYLCDVNDLFLIAAEADRVLKKRSWVAIIDFWSQSFKKNIYHHDVSINSYKLNRPLMFSWHPYYELINQKIVSHKKGIFTDENNEKVCASLIRRYE